MNKRKAIVISLLVVYIVVFVIIAFNQYVKHRMEYDPDDYDTYYDEDNVVELSQDTMDKLNKCETYNEVIKIIGKANRNTGSGLFIVSYNTFDGRELKIVLEDERENDEIVCHKVMDVYIQ